MAHDGPVIRTEDLTKRYGRVRGIVGVNLEVRRGEVFGYLGPNGAGKTTTIRLLLDLIRPTAGRAEILGLDSRRDSLAIRRRVGYLPGELALYESLSGRELVEYFGRLRGRLDRVAVTRLADRLDCDLSREIRTLSHGNKQKLGLVQALMGDPELVILDEPTNGLDPLVQQTFQSLVIEARSRGQTVMVSSHVLPEVERICDRVGMIRDGRLEAVESIADLKAAALRRLDIRFGQPVPPEAFRGLPGVRDLTVDGDRLSCAVVGSVDPIMKAANRFEIVDVASIEPSLEEIFLAHYGGGESHAA